MVGIGLALLCALSYGAGDFVAGLMSRRMHYARVGAIVQASSLVAVGLALPFTGGAPTMDALGWGAVSGLGSGVGSVALYRGFARGQMSVVGPLSGAGSAAIPVVAGLLLGDRPSAVTLAGVVLVVPAIWLISSSGGGVGRRGLVEGAVDGILAGAGFGTLFLALAQAGEDGGLWPVFAGQVVSFVLIAGFAAVSARGVDKLVRPWRTRLGAVGAGVLGAMATVAYLVSTRYGLLVVVSVLAALYPGITVLLARYLLHERSSRVQIVGLVVAAVAVVAIAVG